MSGSFLERLPTLPEAELRRYVVRPQAYKAEAVTAALAELERRGVPVAPADLARIREVLARREPEPPGRLLGATPEVRRTRVRRITSAILAAGLGSAALLYRAAMAPAANPLGYEPLDTKRYLRDLEVVGGKANVVGAEFQRWFEGLWHGRSLASTVAVLTVLLALGFWFVATRFLAPPAEP